MDTTPEHLVREHGPRLRALAARLVGEGDADDVVQQAWVAASKAKPRRLGAWLERVVRRIAGHVRRDAAAVREHERRAAQPVAWQDATAPLERREALEALAAGLAALPNDWAEVVLLRHADGLPPRQIAKRLGIPVNTVRSRARRGLAQLREELGRRGTDWRPALAVLAVPSPREPTAAASLGVLLMSTKTVTALTLIAAAAVATGSALYLELSTPEPSSDIEAVSSSESPHESLLIKARPGMLASPTDAQRIPEVLPSSEVPTVKPTSDHSGRLDTPLVEREFTSLYETKSIEELQEEHDILATQIQEIAMPAYQQRIDAGEYEIIGYGNRLVGVEGDRYKLVLHQFVSLEGSDKKEIRRVELPEDQYRDAYEMLYEVIWLGDELRRRKSAVARAQRHSIPDDD